MLKRHLAPTVAASLTAFPAVLVTGARQVGKSTLAQMLAKGPWQAAYVTLDQRMVLDAALRDPDGFVSGLRPPVVIDEVQRVPDLLRAIKVVVDRTRRKGLFLLTGSANVITLGSVAETLAGRVAVHELHPFSWAERVGATPSTVLDALFAATAAAPFLRKWGRPTPESAGPIRQRILRGGYPVPALMASTALRDRWFASYQQTYVERDVRDLAVIEHVPDFSRLLSLLASRTAQLLRLADVARDLALPYTTVRRYLNLLAVTYQVFLLPSFATNVGQRVMRTPKLYYADTGLACYLSGVDRWEALERQGRVGALMETWVAHELRALMAIQRLPTRLYGWRTSSGQEVDFLLARGERLVAIEVKSTRRLSERDVAGLEACRRAFGSRFGLGVLLYPGTEAVALNSWIVAMPMARFFGIVR